jgi:hypothetical protein
MRCAARLDKTLDITTAGGEKAKAGGVLRFLMRRSFLRSTRDVSSSPEQLRELQFKSH